MALGLHRGSKWLFIGDSITDSGRSQPVGEGLSGALGNGYVQSIAGMLGAHHPELQLRIVNMGTSGNTIRDLKNRWQRDVLNQSPDWLSVMIGINDVWRQFDSPLQKEIHVLPEEFEQTYEELIVATQPLLKRLILATPFYIEPLKEDAMRRRMDEYGEIVRRLAQKFGCRFVDTQAAFDRVLRSTYPASIAWDRVHPNHIGTALLAKAFLDSVDFEWNPEEASL